MGESSKASLSLHFSTSKASSPSTSNTSHPTTPSGASSSPSFSAASACSTVSTPSPPRPRSRIVTRTIVSWIYSSISDEVRGHVFSRGISAMDLWTAISNLYHDNKAARILTLKAAFHGTQQGDMAVMAYCQRMKSMVDSLRDLGETVSNSTLVLTILHGLNEAFSTTAKIMTAADTLPSLPTYLQCRSKLHLEESSHPKPSTPATAFYSNNGGRSPSFPKNGNNGNYNNRGNYKGKNNSNKSHSGFGGSYNGTFQLWPASSPTSRPPASNTPDLLGPCPG